MGCGTLRPEGPRYEVERRRRKSRDAYGADGMGRGEGVFPSRCGRGLGMGQCSPLPIKFFDFRFQMVTFGAFWWFFFYNLAACFTRKNWCFLASKICRCNLLLYFKLMIMTVINTTLTSHHNSVSLTDSSLAVVPSSCKLCMSVVEGSIDTPIAFIIILCMERHILCNCACR